ncbi:MAG TPA: D-cysteine desulfhydrase family protein [Candidatus Competibacter sp.]|nr:D-cysteine desulfhydrase family protein [Candidatus Competibacteraceae bacterium]HRC71918.1 D-cysteine desulfhydrase family protein [Candidatus Competibacter sp.]
MNISNLPKKSLGFFPTPLVELARLGKLLGGPQLFMKRDDLSGLALGGNKTRKLEYLFGDALAQGCDAVITAGASQSNHCRQTAAAAAYSGVECHLVLGGEEPDQPQGNLLLDKLLGCHVHWAGNRRKGEDIPQIADRLKASGKKPYIVPYGGSNELGAIAFVAALEELEPQAKSEPFSHIVFASSSGGTQAGLMVGKKLLNKNFQLIGIDIDKDETEGIPLSQHIVALANRTAAKIGLSDDFIEQDLILNSGYVGEGYGIVGDVENEALSLVAQAEGILLDPVYTGRAMGGLIDLIRTGAIDKKAKVLFWHTGGIPALFAYAEKINLKQRR